MGRLQNPIDEDAPEPMRALAQRLRNVAKAAGYSGVRDLAAAGGLGRGTVSDALSGSRAPSWQTVRRILQACDVQPDTGWKAAQEAAKNAEAQWKQAARRTGPPPESAETGDPRPAGPGDWSLRPPFGELPVHVRGRDDLLAALRDRLAAPARRIQVLHGLGGAGKTTVALRLAQHAWELGHDVFWVSAVDRDHLITGMQEVARQVGADDEDIEDAWAGRASAMDLVWRHLDAADRPWLLVIDNADEPAWLAADSGLPGDGTGWARPSGRGLTVVTSRVGTAEVWGGEAECHPVGVLDTDAGADVLIDLAGHAGAREEARTLAERLGGLPLALTLAGSYIARAGRGAGLLRHRREGRSRVRTFTAYTEALGDIGTELLDAGVRGDLSADGRAEILHRRLVGRTWELTLDLLDTQGLPEARALMRLLSCFAPAPFPVDLIDPEVAARHGLLPDPPSIDRIDLALEALVDLSLLDVVENTPSAEGDAEPVPCLVAHRLVLETNAHWVRADADQSAVWEAAVELLEAGCTSAPEQPANHAWWRLLAPHIQAVVGALPPGHARLPARALSLGLKAFSYLWFRRRFDEAERFVDVLHRRAGELDASHPVRLSIRHRYALARLDGQEAMAEYADVLQAQRRVLGPEDPETLITHHQWAVSLQNAGRLAEAERELGDVLAKRRRVLGPSDPYTAVTYVALAELMRERGHSEEADRYYQEMLRHSGGDHVFLGLEERHQLAHALDEAGRYTEAEQEYRSILSDLEEHDRADTTLYRAMRRCLARNLVQQDRADDATAEYDACVALFAEACGDDDPKTLDVRHERGDMLRRFGRHEAAEAEIRTVLEIRRRTERSEDSVVLQERHCLAHTLSSQDRFDEAAAEMRPVVQAYEEILGPEEKTTRQAKYCLAGTLQDAERWAEAEECYLAVLAAETAVLGADHGDTLITRLRLAEVRLASGAIDTQTAFAEYDEIMPKLVEARGEDDEWLQDVRGTWEARRPQS
ncbi:tetratricopeptide repeat protein [Actinomadura keratinilytica]|jgi:tetratricopeptide (TPR) repeat protein/transcriptional regulator with XRE-family HTH domain|uniref:HTH cro/C1-type domain-containing protein n=1 Tax=Actinomadura keratinilytica TaxID=547461 RepID=A0ABP7YJ07_9ACTN